MSSEEETKSLLDGGGSSSWGLQFDAPRNFVEPVCGGRSVPYVVYRVLAAALFITYLLYTAMEYEYGSKWFISLTHWMILLVALKFVLHAGAATYHFCTASEYCRDQKVYETMPVVFRAIWCLHNITIAIVPVSCIIYWIGIYDGTMDEVNVIEQIVVPVVVAVDSMVGGLPLRLQHVYQPVLVTFIYVFFTLVYWVLRGKSDDHHPYIYSMLNYKRFPGTSLAFAAALVLVCVPTMFLLCIAMNWIVSLLGCDPFRLKPKYW